MPSFDPEVLARVKEDIEQSVQNVEAEQPIETTGQSARRARMQNLAVTQGALVAVFILNVMVQEGLRMAVR